MGFLEGNLGADNDSGIRENLGLVGSDGDVEGLGLYVRRDKSASSFGLEESWVE